MKYRTRFLALLLAGVMTLSLAACTNSEEPDDVPTSPSDSTETDTGSILPEDFVADTTVEDLCLATADIPGDFELFTVNGVPVTARSYLYWLSYNISYLTSNGGTIDWSYSSDGRTLADYLKEDALNTAKLYSLVASNARELGYEMTQDQIDELESTFVFTTMMLGGEEAFTDELRKAGLDYDTLYQINAAPYYYEELMDGLFAEPTDEEMDTYIEENDILYAKHILLATVDLNTREPLDEAAIAEKKATAESLLSQLRASADLPTDFDALMNQYSEDPGLASYPDGYTFTANEMYAVFEEATRALEFGQISGLVESEAGYHIILRLDPDTESTRQQYRADLMTAQMQEWINEADVIFTDEYESLNPRLFYEKLMAYQDAFTAEAAAEAEAEATTDPATESPAGSQEN